jgi:hypothetical protein
VAVENLPQAPTSQYNRQGGLNDVQYLLLIYGNEAAWAAMPKEQAGAMYGEYRAFTEAITKSGNYLGGNPLQPTSTASTVRVRDGKRAVTDGPFAETKEQLGGYYLVEAKDLDEAIAFAARIPGAKVGSIEVRPILQMGPPPA